MKQFNLDDVQNQEDFILGGNNYKFTYPNTEDVEEMQKLPEEQQQDKMLSYISAVNEGAPDIKAALKKANVAQLRAFAKMMKELFSLGEPEEA